VLVKVEPSTTLRKRNKISKVLLDLTDTTVKLRVIDDSPDGDSFTHSLSADEPIIKMTNSSIELTDTVDEDNGLIFIEEGEETQSGIFKGVGLIAKDSTLTLPGHLLEMDGKFASTSTSAILQLENTTVTGSSDLILFSVDGSDPTEISLAGQLLNSSGGKIEIAAGKDLLAFNGGTVTGSDKDNPFLQFNNTAVTIGDDLVGMNGGSLDVEGPLVKFSGGSLTFTGSTVLNLSSGASLTAGGTILDLTNLDLDLGGDPIVRLADGSTLKNTAGPVFKITGGSLTADALVTSDGASNTFDLTGTILDLTNTTVTLESGGDEPEGATDTATFNLATNEPSIKMANSTLKLTEAGDNLVGFGVDSGNPIPQGGVALIATGSSTIEVAGPLLELGGVDLTDTNPQIQLTDSTVTQTGSNSLIEVFGLPVTMVGPLLSGKNSTFTIGSAENSRSDILRVENSATLKGTGSDSLFSFNPSTLTIGRFLDVRSGAKVDLAGPLLKDSGSTYTVERDFVAVRQQNSSLTGTGTTPLLQFSSSTLNVGTEEINGNFFRVDDNQSSDATGPGTVTVAGPLVSDTSSTFTITGRFLIVRDGSTFTSTTTSPLITLSGSTVDTDEEFLSVDDGTKSGSKSRIL